MRGWWGVGSLQLQREDSCSKVTETKRKWTISVMLTGVKGKVRQSMMGVKCCCRRAGRFVRGGYQERIWEEENKKVGCLRGMSDLSTAIKRNEMKHWRFDLFEGGDRQKRTLKAHIYLRWKTVWQFESCHLFLVLNTQTPGTFANCFSTFLPFLFPALSALTVVVGQQGARVTCLAFD